MLAQDTAPTAAPVLDEAKLMSFMHAAVGDWGAIGSAPLVLIGGELGLYDALAANGALTSVELARHTGTVVRYVREWLLNQVAGGIVEYDATTDRYTLPPEHAAALPNLLGGYQVFLAMTRAQPRIAQAFRVGGGLSWSEQDREVPEGTARLFRPGYAENLVPRWIPALDGVEAKLRAGAAVADVGCGQGMTTLLLAQAFPRSTFVGYDIHGPSIDVARDAAVAAGVADRVTFGVLAADAYPAPLTGYDLVAFFDCLHDMVNPTAAARHTYEALAGDGSVLLVEPAAGASVADNHNPVARAFSAASTLVCTPNSLAGNGAGLGALATDAQLATVAHAAGFGRFRRVAETPFNRIFEIRR